MREDVGERVGDRLGAPVRQRQIGDVGADGVGVALDQEGLRRVLLQQLFHRLGDAFELRNLAFGDRGGAELEGQRVEIDAAGHVADAGRTLHLVDRIETLDALDRRLLEEVVVVVLVLDEFGIEDVLLARNVAAASAAGRAPDRASLADAS